MRKQADVTLVSCRISGRKGDFPPIGPLYLAAALHESGHDSQVIDFHGRPDTGWFDVEGLARVLSSVRSEVLGISLFANALPMVMCALDRTRSAVRDRLVVLGGPGVNGNEKRILEQCDAVDLVVRGEGEEALVNIARSVTAGSTPAGPGICRRLPDGTIDCPSPNRIADLDGLPWPLRSRVQMTDYTRQPIVGSRGCPFDCSFCEIITMWGRRVAYRSIADVIREVEVSTKLSRNARVDFIDDTFTINKARVLDLCREMETRTPAVRWSCFSRIDTLDGEMMEAMAAAGCRMVFFGIDTGSELMWKRINKRLSREKVLEVVGESLRYFNATASYIWGYPDESYDEFLETLALAGDVARLSEGRRYGVQTQMHFLCPTRATPIYTDFGHTLRFDEDVPLDICGDRPLRSFSGEPGYAECVARVRSDRALYAPYYHYPSEALDRKFRRVRAETSRLSFVPSRRRELRGHAAP